MKFLSVLYAGQGTENRNRIKRIASVEALNCLPYLFYGTCIRSTDLALIILKKSQHFHSFKKRPVLTDPSVARIS